MMTEAALSDKRKAKADWRRGVRRGHMQARHDRSRADEAAQRRMDHERERATRAARESRMALDRAERSKSSRGLLARAKAFMSNLLPRRGR